MEEMLAMIEAAKDDVANVTEEDIDALLLKSPIPGDAHALVFLCSLYVQSTLW